jgi:hypothetical protein
LPQSLEIHSAAQAPIPTRAGPRLLGGLVLAVFLALCAVPASADADANAEARFYFERGNEGLARAMRGRGAARRRAMQAALSDYLQSLRIVRSKNTVYNLAVCYEELASYEDAFDYFAEYMRADINDAERAEAARRLEAVRPRVAVLQIGSDPVGAEVWVDRRDLAARGRTPLSIAVPAGRHRLFVVREGHAPWEQELEAVVGETARHSIRLDALPAALSIETTGPAADVLVDGRSAGRTPARITLPAGAHEIRLRRAGSDELRERVELRPGEDRTMRLAMPPLPIAGAIAVRANVAAPEVTVDGMPWGAASTAPRGIVPGRHTVVVSAAGYRSAAVVAIVPEGRAVTVRARLSPVDPPDRWGALPAISGIGAGASLAVGALVGLAAIGKQGDLDDAQGRFESAGNRIDSDGARGDAESAGRDIDRLNTTADVFYVGAAVLGTLTVVLLATSRGDEPGPSTALVADADSVGPSTAEVR